jgi:hypothetical protein
MSLRMKEILRVYLLLSTCFLMVVTVTEQRQTLTASSLIQHQDELLHLDNCFTARNFLPHPSSSTAEQSSYRVALESTLASPPHAACASCYLCHLHQQPGHLEAHTTAYIYATRALLMFPRLVPALTCIAALYLRQNNILRANFYAELAYRRSYDPSRFVTYNDIGNSEHLHVYLQAKGDTHSRMRELAFCADAVADMEEYAALGDILLALRGQDLDRHGDISTTLLTAYWSHLHLLPRSLVGPSITAYEAFLDHLEGAEAACALGQQLRSGTPPPARALHVFPEYLPDIWWPVDKTIIIFSYVQIDSVLKTFGENNMGLSDALNKLGEWNIPLYSLLHIGFIIYCNGCDK